MKQKLKPCPFCGCKKLSLFKVILNKTYFRIVCDNKKFATAWLQPHVEGPIAETEEEAAVLWNNRTGN